MKKILSIIFILLFSTFLFAKEESLKPEFHYDYIKNAKNEIYGNVDTRSVGELQTKKKRVRGLEKFVRTSMERS